jgi:hypothetical protein
MRKTLVLIISLQLAAYICYAQVTLQPLLSQAGIFEKNQLWNILAVNGSANTYDCYIILSLEDRESGTEILSATSTSFSLGREAQQLSIAALTPIQYSYFSFAGDQANDFLPVGNYTACYKLIGNGHGPTELAEACVPFDVAPLSPPTLIIPADSSVLKEAPVQFTWQPPSPLTMFQQLHYEIVIAEILPGQTPEEAVELNAPFYMDLNAPGSFLNYNGAYPSFEKGKWYGWQVVAEDGKNYAAKTPVWDFMIDTLALVNNIVEQTPYIKMKKDGIEKGIAPNGILKLSYVNETTDSIATVQIIDISGKKQYQFKTPIKPGENLIEYDLRKLIKGQDNKMYEAQIINSRKEKWVLEFQVYNYKQSNK